MAEPIRGGLEAFDCNGDGRDELLVLDGDLAGGRLCAWDRELKDLWAWPRGRSKAPGPTFFDPHEIELGFSEPR